MKILKYTIFTLAFGLTTASCNFLEKEPTKLTPEVYFNNATEAQSFLTGVYAILGQGSFYGESYLHLSGGDDLSNYGGASTRAPMDKGLICANAVSSDPLVTGLWYTLYSGINRANMFLENIDRVPDMDDKLRAQLTSEARFLRAFYYFTLVENWGDVPFRTESVNTVVGLDLERTDRQTIYDFIIKEMSDAADPEVGGLLSAAELGKDNVGQGVTFRRMGYDCESISLQSRRALPPEPSGYSRRTDNLLLRSQQVCPDGKKREFPRTCS